MSFNLWLSSPSTVTLEPKKIKSVTVSSFLPFVCHEVMGPDAMILVFWLLSFCLIYLFFNWRITALQNFVVFCQTLTCRRILYQPSYQDLGSKLVLPTRYHLNPLGSAPGLIWVWAHSVQKPQVENFKNKYLEYWGVQVIAWIKNIFKIKCSPSSLSFLTVTIYSLSFNTSWQE